MSSTNEMTKNTYERIVRVTLQSMIDVAKADREYCLKADLDNYYHTKIKTDNILTLEEFNKILNEVAKSNIRSGTT